MDVKDAFKDFNASKFVLFTCLLPFSILLSLQLSQTINISMWLLFTPLWILDIIVIVGAFVGTVVWFRHPESRRERDGYTDYKALLITLGLYLTLLMFELLVCYKTEILLQAAPRIWDGPMWLIVFTPLFFASPIAVAACVWGFRNDRSLELEAILSANVLLFIFTALKLDGTVSWDWTAVFIPLWVIMCLPSVAVLYYFAWALIFCRAAYHNERKWHLLIAFNWICIVVPLLFFQVLLAYKLDNRDRHSWSQIFYPLHLSLLALILSSFGTKGGNRWWFGMRSEFCPLLLHHCPFLTIYGNISYQKKRRRNADDDTPPQSTNQQPSYAHLYGSSKKDPVNKVTRAEKGSKFDCIIVPIDTPD